MSPKERHALQAFADAVPYSKDPKYIAAALHKVLAEKDIKSLAKTIGKQLDARSMVAKPIAEASILPPYGTILRNKIGEHAMYVSRGITPSGALHGNVMVILDDKETYIHTCTDMQMLKDWQIVSEAQ